MSQPIRLAPSPVRTSCPRQWRTRTRLWWLAGLLVLWGVAGCGDEDESDGYTSAQCRFDPDSCPGLAGALCDSDRDCREPLYCCTENGNCGGGMCTAECNSDRDCPANMACAHSKCFYLCHDDRDCADGMSCEHDSTICEWP